MLPHEFLQASPTSHRYALVDGAQHPEETESTLKSVPFDSVLRLFDATPDEGAGNAGVFLLVINLDANWAQKCLAEFDSLDLRAPCLSLISSPLANIELVKHLRAFLYADIGEGLIAMLRFFDPRVLPAALRAWSGTTAEAFLGPIERWWSRGHSSQWQPLTGSSSQCSQKEPVAITLDQQRIDALGEHCEADQLLTILGDRRLLGSTPAPDTYFERYSRFRIHYDALRAQGMRDTAQLLRALSHGFSNGHLDWPRPELRQAFTDLLTNRIDEEHFFDKIDRQSAALQS